MESILYTRTCTRTTTDDIRSYEQTVLARRAPLTPHVASWRRGNTTSTWPAATPAAPPPPGKGNRASPAGSGSNGSDRSMSAFTDDRPSRSRGSPISSGGSRGIDNALWPTFKQLPSQTPGPEYTKQPATGSMLPRTHEEFSSIFKQKAQERGLGGVAAH
jgi:hypothetical protein